MNDLILLRTLRDDVAEPTAEQLAPALARLDRAMSGQTVRVHRAPRARWALVAAGIAAVLALVAGNITATGASAQAAAVLHAAALATVKFADPVVGSGEYLRSSTHARWPVYGAKDGKTVLLGTDDTVQTVYVPAKPGATWVLVTSEHNAALGVNWDNDVTRRTPTTSGPDLWMTDRLSNIPTGTGAEVLAYFDAHYRGGSTSRDEDNFVRITDLLRSGLVPAKQRAGMFEALALIPGVTSTPNVANLDGQIGVAIGRTEPLRDRQRAEMIIDPATGLVIGERVLTTNASDGTPADTVIGSTSITTNVVNSAP